jgi:predicted ATPase/transcriptional regulator with XRE-family HTH domain
MAAREDRPFGELLRRLRLRAGHTQESLAARAGLSVRGISDLERGVNRGARRETARLFADALDLTGDERERFLVAARGEATAQPPLNGALPVPPTPIIGREADLQALLAFLAQPDCRLVTLSGTGGVGKTRLALEAAAHTADHYPDGVWFVDLAPLADAALLDAAIAQALELSERPDQSVSDAVTAFLAPKRALLILDNVEHLLGAVPRIAQILIRCPALTLLATSRTPLRLRAEQVWSVSPLRLPDLAENDTVAALQANAAVALFTQRARAVDAGFTLDTANAGTVAEICLRLDGLPLAIELAAARIALLAPAAILTRLRRRLTLLTGGARDLPLRHQTLRNAIDWSYQLLTPGEQALFRRLAVFAGGATLDAANAVSPGAGAEEVVDAAATLVGWSLVRREAGHDGEPRLRMLETIREYALERLAVEGEAAAAHQAHAEHFLTFAEEADPHLTGPDQAAWLHALDSEQDNLRAALTWTIGQEDAVISLRLAGALWWYWEIRGHFAEGQSWLERAIAVGEARETRWQAKALFALGAIAYRRRDLVRSEERLNEALVLYRELGDAAGESWCLSFRGLGALVRGEVEQAEALHEVALALAREAGDVVTVIGTLSNLGEVSHARGDLMQAEAFYAESLTVAETMANPLVTARSLTNVAIVAAELGQLRRAAGLHQDALRVYFEVGDRRGIASSLEGIAAAAASLGQANLAARIFGAAATLRAAIGSPVPVIEQAMHERGIALARQQLGEAAFTRAWDSGAQQRLEDAVASALARIGDAWDGGNAG